MKTKNGARASMSPADKERADIMARAFGRLAVTMDYLAGRWADEKEYEDIADYQCVIERVLREEHIDGVTITNMTRRPFGFVCVFRGATYRFTRTMREYKYARIG